MKKVLSLLGVPLAIGLIFQPVFGNDTPVKAEITVDVAQGGPAISPHIYGQFIEHLGRCIYDGIWAEMLRDRKFLFQPGLTWEIVKPDGAQVRATHDLTGTFAGRPCVSLGILDAKSGRCGIRQSGLGLVAGKEYVGYAILRHAGKPVPVEVRLAWGPKEADGQSMSLRDVGEKYTKFPFRFRAGASAESASLSLTVSQAAQLQVACLSLMPADHINGLRPDTLELARKLAPPILRWPGGNFVSGYDWKDGIGPRDERPPRWERAWNDVESNDFGVDEFLAFCKEIGAEPYLAVNSGLGTAEEAAHQVEYVNGSKETRWGGQRAKNGHPEPYRVVWWGVGNEMYGEWQLGNIPVERYAARHNDFVESMKFRDGTIKIVAVGNPGRWNDLFLPACATHMDLVSGHHYTRRQLRLPFTPADAAKYQQDFPGYSDSVAEGIRRLTKDMRQRQGIGNGEIDKVRLAVDEWGIVRDWNLAPDGPGLGVFEHYYCLGDAIATGRGLHQLIRDCDLVAMANWAQTVNVIGAIKTSRTHAVLDPTGHVLALYRAQLGGELVPVKPQGNAPLDAIASWREKDGALSLGLINYSADKAIALTVSCSGGFKPTKVDGWRINGVGLEAINVPGKPEAVTTTPLASGLSLQQPLTLPPHSVTVLTIKGDGVITPPVKPVAEEEYRGFKEPQRVEIRGYDGHAMEAFITKDGRFLLFNDKGKDMNLHYAERIDDLAFQYKGEIKDANTKELDGVPSMDKEGLFYFVSVRSYGETFSTLYRGRFKDGAVTGVELVPGVSLKKLGMVNFDAEISADGKTLYFVDGLFHFPKDVPETADLVIAVRDGEGFRRDPQSSEILKQVNTAEALEFAPAISADGLELFFTRIVVLPSPKTTIWRTTRAKLDQPFEKPQKVAGMAGFFEAPTLTHDGKTMYFHKLEKDRFVIYCMKR